MCRAREVLDDLATPGAAEVLAIPTPPEITPMPVNRHQQARTTPAIRQELRESPLSMAALARHYHLTQATGRQWRRRAETTDRSHRPQRLHPTRSPAPEAVVASSLLASRTRRARCATRTPTAERLPAPLMKSPS